MSNYAIVSNTKVMNDVAKFSNRFVTIYVIFTNLKKIVAFSKFLAGERIPCFKSSATDFGSIPSVCVWLCACVFIMYKIYRLASNVFSKMHLHHFHYLHCVIFKRVNHSIPSGYSLPTNNLNANFSLNMVTTCSAKRILLYHD